MESSGMNVGAVADALIERAGGLIEMPGIQLDFSGLSPGGFGVGGVYTVEVFDPAGNLKASARVHNGVTSAALDHVLNIVLRNQPQQSSWFLGLVGSDNWTSGFNAADTMASHVGWAEFTGYSQATRPQWAAGAPSGNAVSNAATCDFTISGLSAAKTLQGVFLASENTKGGAVGSANFVGGLFSTAAFTGGQTIQVNNGDTVKVTYTVSAAAQAGQ